MRIPSRLQDLVPPEAVKQLMELVGQPSLLGGLREAAQKLGWKESWQATNLRDAMQQAKRWVESVGVRFGREDAVSRSSINATGQIFGPPWASVPLSSQAIQAFLVATSGYCSISSTQPAAMQALADSVGAEKATVVHSIPLALRLVAQMRGSHGGIVVPRADCLRIGKIDIRSVLENNGRITEIGASNGCEENDFLQALQQPHQTTVTLFPSSMDSDSEMSLHHDAAIRAAKKKNAVPVEVILNASLVDLKEFGLSVPTVGQRIQSGAELIIIPGDGLVGGPTCALVLGKTDLVDEIEDLAGRSGSLPHVGVLAAMYATIEQAVDRDRWKDSPVGAMITNSQANLEDRARRLSIQLQASEEVGSVCSESLRLPLGDGAWAKWSLTSPALRIVPRNNSVPRNNPVEKLAARMRSLPVPIVGLEKSDALYLVLRTIEPSEDREIGAFFLDAKTTEEERVES